MADKWLERPLGDCVRLLSGGTPSKSRADFWNGSVPWVSAKDMKSYWIEDSEDHLSEIGASEATHIVDAGTTLMLVRGMTLHNDIPICRTRHRAAFNQDVKAVLAQPGINPDFLPYLLLGNKFKLLSIVDSAGHGTGRLNSDTLLNFPVSTPSETEQRAIACILAALDDKIQVNQRMNRTLEALAGAVFKSWFVDFDPVRAKGEGRNTGIGQRISDLFPDSFDRSEVGDVPKSWRVCGLDEVARFLNGLALQKFPPTDAGSLPVIKIAQLRAGNTEGADQASADLDEEYIVEDGDVLFSWSGSLECVLWAGGRGALNQHLFKVTSDKYPKWFFYLGIHQHLDEFRQIAAGKATTMGHIQRHHLSDAKVAVPPAPVLEAADAIIAPIIEQAWRLAVQSRTTARVRDNLLPRLISGNLRVPDAERIIQRCA